MPSYKTVDLIYIIYVYYRYHTWFIQQIGREWRSTQVIFIYSNIVTRQATGLQTHTDVAL